MSQKYPVAKRLPTFNVTTRSAVFLVGWCSLALLPLYYSLSYFAMGNAATGLVYLVLSGLYVWLLAPAITCYALTIYLQKHLNDRSYMRVDHAYTRALNWLKRAPVIKWPYLPSMTSNLALTHMYQGHYESAESLFREALQEALKDKRQSARPALVIYLFNAGAACARLENYVEAELFYDQALEIAKSLSPAKAAVLSAWPLFGIGSARLQLGELDSAEKYIEDAIHSLDSARRSSDVRSSTAHLAIVRCHLLLALLNAKKGNWDQSQKCTDNFLEAVKRNPISVDTLCLTQIYQTVDQYLQQGLFDNAERLLELGYIIAKDFPFHPDSQRLIGSYEKLLLLTDRKSDVEDMKHFLRSPALLTFSGENKNAQDKAL
ncbi:MAG TPA: tetratricopeptide repeat protein [Planktothrix sp.]|jgi:tetratricopeptide (TPR) repeat protein